MTVRISVVLAMKPQVAWRSLLLLLEQTKIEMEHRDCLCRMSEATRGVFVSKWLALALRYIRCNGVVNYLEEIGHCSRTRAGA